MKKESLYNFVFFGTAFRYLQDCGAGGNFQYHGSGAIRHNLRFFFKFIETNNMKVSINAAARLRNLMEKFDNTYKKNETNYDEEQEESLTDQDADLLSALINEIRIVIFSESEEVTAFFPQEKRYNIDYLFGNIGMIFGAHTLEVIPASAVLDFEEACKCIVLERSTASAFHLMRGCECVLKHYYFTVVKRNRKDPAMWANMVSHLMERKALSAETEGMLTIFRKNYRNPVSHPERFFSIDDAQDLLGTTTQLISSIISQEKYKAANHSTD